MHHINKALEKESLNKICRQKNLEKVSILSIPNNGKRRRLSSLILFQINKVLQMNIKR